MNTERLKELETWELKSGSHDDVQKGLCVMEAVAYVAGEPHSDHPTCSCPVLTRYAACLNDKFDTETRQKLKPLIQMLIETRADIKTEIKRSKFMVNRMLTVIFPIFTDALRLTEVSKRLRSTGDSNEEFSQIRDYLREQNPGIRKAAYAAAAAADAAAADADAVYAADAAAYAAYAAAAYAAYAAYAAAADADAASPKWVSVMGALNDSAIETLRLACGIK